MPELGGWFVARRASQLGQPATRLTSMFLRIGQHGLLLGVQRPPNRYRARAVPPRSFSVATSMRRMHLLTSSFAGGIHSTLLMLQILVHAANNGWNSRRSRCQIKRFERPPMPKRDVPPFY